MAKVHVNITVSQQHLEAKAAVAIAIAQYGSNLLHRQEDAAVGMMDLSLEALKSIRDQLREYNARNP